MNGATNITACAGRRAAAPGTPAYERLGVGSYWLLDPVQPGGLEVYELDEQGR